MVTAIKSIVDTTRPVEVPVKPPKGQKGKAKTQSVQVYREELEGKVVIDSLTPSMQELERALVWAASWCHRDLGTIVPTLQIKGKVKRCNAVKNNTQKHTAWSTREGEYRTDVSFSTAILSKSPVEIIGACVHEVAHLAAEADYNAAPTKEEAEAKYKECSKSGRHNSIFQSYAKMLGLECEAPYDSYGYGYTSPSAELVKAIDKQFRPDIAKLNLFRTVFPPSGPTGAQKQRWACRCAAPNTQSFLATKTAVMNVTCNVCEQLFVAEDRNHNGPVTTISTT
jgi:hypothetical protein